MEQIEEVEKFKNCTQLCKPHESSKAVWQISNMLQDARAMGKEKYKEFREELLEVKEMANKQLTHPEFI